MKMSIHRALGELKTLEKRINKEISNGNFIGFKMGSSNKDYNTKENVEDFNKMVKESLQSINDLIKRRKTIKELIVQSNANTIVEIANNKITVASAIERKDSIIFEQNLLEKMKCQYNNALVNVNKLNEKMENSLNDKIEALISSDKSLKNSDMVISLSKTYRDENEWSLIDDIKLKEIIDKMENDIISFINEVDVVLSESNATTFIEVE